MAANFPVNETDFIGIGVVGDVEQEGVAHSLVGDYCIGEIQFLLELFVVFEVSPEVELALVSLFIWSIIVREWSHFACLQVFIRIVYLSLGKLVLSEFAVWIDW